MSKKSWLDRVRDAFTAKDEAGMKAALDDVESIMNLTGNPDSNESQTHVHLYLGEPATTKPEGGLPETGEARVTSAKDDAAKVGGEHEATFGGKSFFTDAKLEEEFKGIKDSIEALNKKVDDAFPPKDKEDTKDKEPGEESAHEKADKEIEGELEEEAPPGTGDKAKKAKDSALLEDSFAETVSLAAILVPSIAIPTFDKATDPKSTLTSICALRRKALKAYSVTTDGAEVLAKITKRANLDTMPCAYLAPIFRGAAATQAARNEAAAVQRNTQDAKLFGSREDSAPAIRTLADVQRANDEFNAKQAAGL